MVEGLKSQATQTGHGANTGAESPREIVRAGVCPVCQEERWRRDDLAQAILSLPNSVLVVRCESCGLRRLEPYLSPDELQQFYGPAYFGDKAAGTGMEGVRSADDNYLSGCVPARLKKFRRTVKLLRERHPSGKTLLDFGAATGDFVAIARKDGLDADGVELSGYAVQVARERNGIQLSLGGCEAIPDRKYDFIHLHHVFEHLVRPSGELSLLADHLAPAGILHIEVPYQFHFLERFRYRLNRAATRGMPTVSSFHHPFFYTPRTLRRMLERTGLDVVSVRTYVSWHYDAHGIRERLKGTAWWLLDRMFLIGNIIEAVAKRPER